MKFGDMPDPTTEAAVPNRQDHILPRRWFLRPGLEPTPELEQSQVNRSRPLIVRRVQSER
jgi:hypothetical protein